MNSCTAFVVDRSATARLSDCSSDEPVYLGHIHDAIHDIEEYTAGADLALVWTAVERDVPQLRSAVDGLLT